jgi:hypothetical protein
MTESSLFDPVRHEPLAGAPWSDAAARAAIGRIVADALDADLEPDPLLGCRLWMQDLYGRRSRYLGAGHGFAGKVFPFLRGAALLKLWQRTGDDVWRNRARALAMHAIGQVDAARVQHGQGRRSLWTGDLGVACIVQACRDGDPRFPSLDVF